MSSHTLQDLSLFPATPEQAVESRKRSAVEWGRGRSIDQYVERDRIMDEHEHAKDGKLTTWVLTPRDDPTTLDFMCACETFRRESIVIRRPTVESLAQVQDVYGYGIASVFTPPSKRKKGYARHMMRLLHWVLAPHADLPAFPPQWGIPPAPSPHSGNAQFSVLYSDVGADFYHNSGPDGQLQTGWAVKGSVYTVWNVNGLNTKAPPDSQEWNWLSGDDADALYAKEAQIMRREVVHDAPIGVSFAFLPDKGVGAFNINRTMEFVGQTLTPVLPLVNWGTSLQNDPEANPTYATWTVDVRPSDIGLVITRLRIHPAHLTVVLHEAADAARSVGAQSVEIWNLPEHLKGEAEKLGGVTQERDDHLPAFKWYGQEKNEDLYWLYNEKFCWC